MARDQITGDASTPTVSPAARILVLINERRVKAKLVPLRRDLVLASLARFHNRNMRRDGFFAHDHPQAQTFYERLAHLNRRYVGEVIAYGSGGFGTARGIVDLWFASPSHKRVLMAVGMRRIGISVIRGPYLGQPSISLATADLSS